MLLLQFDDKKKSISVSNTFYCLQVNKSKKWACKVCGEKQSVKRVYAQGSGQDCRKHVQKLNMRSGDLQMTKSLTLLNGSNENSVAENSSCSSEDRRHVAKPSLDLKESKWNKFMDVSSGNRNGKYIFHIEL